MPRDDFYPTPPNSIESEKMTSRRYCGVQKKSSPPLVREFRIVRPVRPLSKPSFGQPILLFVTAKPWSLRWHAVASSLNFRMGCSRGSTCRLRYRQIRKANKSGRREFAARMKQVVQVRT